MLFCWLDYTVTVLRFIKFSFEQTVNDGAVADLLEEPGAYLEGDLGNLDAVSINLTAKTLFRLNVQKKQKTEIPLSQVSKYFFNLDSRRACIMFTIPHLTSRAWISKVSKFVSFSSNFFLWPGLLRVILVTLANQYVNLIRIQRVAANRILVIARRRVGSGI